MRDRRVTDAVLARRGSARRQRGRRVRWRLGVAEFDGLAQNRDVRPDEAPQQVPDWAWESLDKVVSTRSPPAPSG